MKISPVTERIGAIVEGVNLATASAETLQQIEQTLAQHLVLYFPAQSLDRFQLRDLGQKFGPSFRHPIVDNGFDDCPEVLELRREPNAKTVFGGASWHADVSYLKPGGYILDFARQNDSVGGWRYVFCQHGGGV